MTKVLNEGLSIPVYLIKENKRGILTGRIVDIWGGVWYVVRIAKKDYTTPAKNVKISNKR